MEAGAALGLTNTRHSILEGHSPEISGGQGTITRGDPDQQFLEGRGLETSVGWGATHQKLLIDF